MAFGFGLGFLNPSETTAVSQGLWTPARIATTAWYDAVDLDTITEGVGQRVTQWDDKSGNDRHMTQGTLSAQPFTGFETFNGMNAIDFFLAYMQSSVLQVDYADGFYVLAVARMLELETVRIATNWGSVNAGNWLMSPNATNVNRSFVRTPSSLSSAIAGVPNDQHHVFGLKYDESTSTLTSTYQDLESTGTVLPPYVTVTDALFTLGADSNGANQSNVEIGELVVVKGAFNLTNFQFVEGYLAHKWGLEGELDAGQPHKDEPPRN